MNLRACFAFATLVLPACATHSTSDSAAPLSADEGVELDGPGVRVRPSSSMGTLKTRAVRLPAGVRYSDTVVVRDGGTDLARMSFGSSKVVPRGNYVVERDFWRDPVTVGSGSAVDITPLFVYSVLPIPFDRLRIGGVEARYGTDTAYAWSVERGAFSSSSGWALHCANHSAVSMNALVPPGRVPASGTFDVTPQLTKVHLELDDIDPDYPTAQRTALSADWFWKDLRSLAADFLVAPGRQLNFHGSAGLVADGTFSGTTTSFAGMRPAIVAGPAGTTTTIRVRRLEVDDLALPDGTLLRGRFSVGPLSGATHTGVDLPSGSYTLTVTARDASGQTHTDTQTITL